MMINLVTFVKVSVNPIVDVIPLKDITSLNYIILIFNFRVI